MMTDKLRRLPRAARGDEGVTTLEIAIVFPVFFAALMLVFQAAMYHFAAQVALAAAQAGGRQTAIELGQGVEQDKAIADGEQIAIAYLQKNGGTAFGTIKATPSGTPLNAQRQIQFVVTTNVLPLPIVSGLDLPISRTAIVNPEIFTHG